MPEELYYLVDGPEQIGIGEGAAAAVLDVEEGAAVRVETGTGRQLRNDTDTTSAWLVIGAPNVRAAELWDDDREEFVSADEYPLDWAVPDYRSGQAVALTAARYHAGGETVVSRTSAKRTVRPPEPTARPASHGT